jgi:hypothetical protein
MINKIEIQSVINKYYLNGLIESVKWDIKDKILNIKFTAPTREMIGEINFSNFNLENSTIGINNTSQLLKLLNITSGDILLSYVKNNKSINKLIISDNQFTVNYTLADVITVPKTGEYNGSEEYNLETALNEEIISSLIKAKSSLSDSDTVVLNAYKSLDGEFQLELTFGGDIEYSNKVSYYLSNFIQKDVPYEFKVCFNSDLLKEILLVNKGAETAKLFINLGGLIKLEFTEENTTSKYYLVKKDI